MNRRRQQELERHEPPTSGDDDDYLAVPDDRMELLAQSVALVKVARGADFTKLVSFSNSTSLYIDLNDATGKEEEFSVQGFNPKRVFFITLSKEVPLDTVSEVMTGDLVMHACDMTAIFRALFYKRRPM